jgi:POT family proton-dependent oligopeptide transporter
LLREYFPFDGRHDEVAPAPFIFNDEECHMQFTDYFRKFAVLKEARREFWGIQAVNFLDSLYAFAYVMIAVVFMTSSLGFSDIGAGAALSWLGILTSIFLFAAGPIVDRLGVKRALYFALAAALVVRGVATLAAFWADMPMRQGIFLLCLGLGGLPGAIKSTVYQVGNRRFTTKASEAAGFNIWYVIMNVAAILAGLLVDFVHLTLDLDFAWIIAVGLVTAALSYPIALFWIRDDSPAEDGRDGTPKKKTSRERGKGWAHLKDVVRNPAFARMMAVMTLTLGVRAAFLYWSVLSPKYWYRAIGPEARVGLLESINPVIIVGGLFLLVPVINKFGTFKMLTWGSFIAAISFFPMAVPWHWVSDDATTAYYAMSAFSMVLFSVGEIMFSPRLSHYIIAIAPVGQEGVYSSFAALPWFVGKTVAGFFSGVLLTRWCAETVVVGGTPMPLHDAIVSRSLAYGDSPEMMWLILGVIALVGPLVMLPLKGWFTRGMRENAETA